MTMKDFEMKLSDNIHLLKAHELVVSSYDSEVHAKSIKISPYYLTDNQIKEPKHLLYNIFVQDFKIKNINIREAYNYKILPINIIEITNPDIQIKNYKKQKTDSEKEHSNTSSILSEYLNEIIVDTFRLTNGTFNITGLQNKKDKAYTSGKVKFSLFGINVDPVAKTYQKILKVKNIEFSLNNYKLYLADNLHLIKAGEIGISTSNSKIFLKNLSIQPVESYDISKQKISEIINLNINRIDFNNIDILNAYFDKKLTINEILIKQPKFKLTYFEKFKKTQNKSENNNKIQEILNNNLEFIKINKIIAEKGSFNLCKDGTENIFDEENISVKITGFFLDSVAMERNDRILFSEDIEIRIKDYTFNFPDKKHRLTTDEIGISIAGSQIFAKEINIFPIEEINTPADIKMLYKIHSPELTLSGIDFNKVYFNKIIQIKKIYLKNT